MILDIDNSESVQAFVRTITSCWFDIDSMYHNLKSGRQTNWSDFWTFSDCMIGIISNYLKCSSEQFLKQWEEKCTICGATLRGYHCTCHSNKDVFVTQGLLPLSEKTVKISQNQKRSDAKERWNYRIGRGPFFFLSYQSARNADNSYFEGPEILLEVDGHQSSSNRDKSMPLIIHCEIPFSILPNKQWIIYCTLRTYMNLLDPEDGTDGLPEGAPIDLQGNPLDPKYIVRIEEI